MTPRMLGTMPATTTATGQGGKALIISIAAIALFAVPVFLLTPSPLLMHTTVYGSLALGVAALLLSLAADGDGASGLTRVAAALAGLMAGAGLAAIYEVYVVAPPVANTGAGLLAALLFALVIATVALWRARAHDAFRWRDKGLVKGLIALAGLAAAIFCYGGSVAVTIDQAHEAAAPQLFQAELYAQNIRHDWKHGRVFNELHLGPWGTQPARELDVDLPTYDKVSEGLNVCPEFHPGLLGIGWFRITACPPALLQVTHHIPRDMAAEQRRSDMIIMPLVALGGIAMIALSGAGLATGTMQGRYGSYNRADSPISFWFNVVIIGALGGMLLVVALGGIVGDLLAP